MSAIPSLNQSNNPYRLLQLSQSSPSSSAQNAASSVDLAALALDGDQGGAQGQPSSALNPSNGQFVDAYA